MSKRTQLKDAHDEAIKIVKDEYDKLNTLDTQIAGLGDMDYSAQAAAIGYFYPDAFAAATPELPDNYLFNTQDSFNVAMQAEIQSLGLEPASLTAEQFRESKIQERDELLSGMGPFQNAPELKEFMETTVAIMREEGRPELDVQIAQCETVIRAIEHNEDELSSGTPHTIVRLCAADIAMESGCNPGDTYLKGLLASSISDDLQNTGQRLSLEDVDNVLSDCHHLSSDVKASVHEAVSTMNAELEEAADVDIEM